MKKLLRPLLAALLLIKSLSAQIPNASFEFWTNNVPDEWITNSSSPIIPVSQTTDAYSGSYAIRGEVIDDNGNPYTPSFSAIGSGGAGFQINQAYTGLTGWYKANMIGSDIGFVYITVFDNSQPPSPVGVGYIHLTTTNGYQMFDAPITYSGIGTPAYASITFSIVDTGSSIGFVGSYIQIDDLALTAPTQIEGIDRLSVSVNQNPVIDNLSITGNFKNNRTYSVSLINTVGKSVLKKALTANENSLPILSVDNLVPGYYFLNVSDSQNSFTRRVLISN